MGLDIVELIMRVEETFEIEIPDEEASELNTVGKLYQAILCRLGFEDLQRCPSSAVFYQARHALMQMSGVPRN